MAIGHIDPAFHSRPPEQLVSVAALAGHDCALGSPREQRRVNCKVNSCCVS